MIIEDRNLNYDLDPNCQVSQRLIVDLISKMEVIKILPYRVGKINGHLDYCLSCSNSSEGIGELRRLHRILAGEKTDNHQIIILKGAILKFSDFSVYIYLNETEVEIKKHQFKVITRKVMENE